MTGVVGRFFDLSAEAERIDADLNGDVEPALEAVLLHVLAHPESRRELAEAFLEVARDSNKGPPELVQYCMHALRWPEVKQELVHRLETEKSERVRHVLRKLVMSFEDDWYDADAYARFNNDKNCTSRVTAAAGTKMKLSFPAWNGTHYVSLAELLSQFGDCFADAHWHLRMDEAAPEPGGYALESVDPRTPMRLEKLMRLITPGIQIIDGEVNAIDLNGRRCISIGAIDSTWWDVETENSQVISIIRRTYPVAREV